MGSKKVSDMIINKLAETIKKENIFENISQELINKLKKEKPIKDEISVLLKKTE
jgi:uncharacterized protein YdcH (DUF465 family)